MNVKTNQYETCSSIASRWRVHRTSVLRIMRRHGFAGSKMGPSQTSPRRFLVIQVNQVESLFGQ